MIDIQRFQFTEWDEYKLLDSGDGRKLELFKNYIIDRPEPKAQWARNSSYELWNSADAIFNKNDIKNGEWLYRKDIRIKPWITKYKSISFKGFITPFGHVGYFPDKQKLWDLIHEYTSRYKGSESMKGYKVLNLFGYTGVASLIALNNDAKVVHVDSSKKAISWAKDNQRISNLENKNIRFILDDVTKFVNREVLRGCKYDLIMLDPPTYGCGSNNETWNINKNLVGLLESCKNILNDIDSLLLLNTYSSKLSHIELGKLCKSIFNEQRASIITGELAIREDNSRRLIPQSQFSIVKYSSFP